jgi:hypothetical protein
MTSPWLGTLTWQKHETLQWCYQGWTGPEGLADREDCP